MDDSFFLLDGNFFLIVILILASYIIAPIYIEKIYLRIAQRLNILSSDGKGVITGGGIVFPIVYIATEIASLMSKGAFTYPYFLAGITIIATVSFIDDMRNLPPLFRLAVHFMCAWLLIIQAALSSLPIWENIVFSVICVAIINAFNFLDGIKGITLFYAFVAFLFLPGVATLFLLPIIAVGCYILRTPERCYLGDVGAITFGYIFSFALIMDQIPYGIEPDCYWIYAPIPTPAIDFALLTHIAVYLADFGITLLLRIYRRENILQPHRKHLYQLLAYNCHINSMRVAMGYAAVQFVISTVFVMMPDNYRDLTAIASAGLLILIYFIIYRRISKIALT